MAKSRQNADKPDFEKDLQELEALVARMEQGEMSLEASLGEYERGIALTRRCQQALDQAEQKVRRLSGDGRETDLDMPDDAASDSGGDGGD